MAPGELGSPAGPGAVGSPSRCEREGGSWWLQSRGVACRQLGWAPGRAWFSGAAAAVLASPLQHIWVSRKGGGRPRGLLKTTQILMVPSSLSPFCLPVFPHLLLPLPSAWGHREETGFPVSSP